MFEALLMLTLVIAFMPALLNKLAQRKAASSSHAAAQHLVKIFDAASEFIKENGNNLPIGIATSSGEHLNDLLEPYGLPIGFSARTPLSQTIQFTILNNGETILPLIIASDAGRLDETTRRNLSARIGFWAGLADAEKIVGGTGGWEMETENQFGFTPAETDIYIRIPVAVENMDLLAKKAGSNNNAMQTDMNLAYYNLNNANELRSSNGIFEMAFFGLLNVNGGANTRDSNDIESFAANSATFASTSDASSALNLAGGILTANSISAGNISSYGAYNTELESDFISVLDFYQTPGSSAFYGPEKWLVRGNAELTNTALAELSVLNVGALAEITSDSNIFIDETSGTARSGISTDIATLTHITLRDQTAKILLSGDASAPALIYIRPRGASLLPDVKLNGINNEGIRIPTSPGDDSGATTTCRSVIENIKYQTATGDELRYTYDQRSLAQYIACTYAYYQRLEQRIEIKKCLLETEKTGGDSSKCL